MSVVHTLAKIWRMYPINDKRKVNVFIQRQEVEKKYNRTGILGH